MQVAQPSLSRAVNVDILLLIPHRAAFLCHVCRVMTGFRHRHPLTIIVATRAEQDVIRNGTANIAMVQNQPQCTQIGFQITNDSC
ncbi:hypothetical protein COOONC_24628 [Cooperia oncophora]